MLNIPNLGLVNINAYAKFAQIPNILSRNEITTSIKGHNCYLFAKIDA